MTEPKLRFLTAWFCPFAHRAHIALEHLRLRYEWVEALGWFQENGEWHHYKTDELRSSNPMGTVPTFIETASKAGAQLGTRSVYESLVCIEYCNDLAALAASNGGAMGRRAFSDTGTANDGNSVTRKAPSLSSSSSPHVPLLLLSTDPFERAKQRAEAQVVNKTLCSPYYSVLVRTDEEERREHFERLLRDLRAFSRRMGERQMQTSRDASGSGDNYYCWGDGKLSIVDCALLPHAYRYFVLEHFRGRDFAIPKNDPDLEPFHRWLLAMTDASKEPAIAPTLPNKKRYLEHVRKYAENTARSKVAEAVRAGTPAHEMK